MVGNLSHPSRQVVIIGKDSPAVPVAAEVFAGEERGAADMAYRPSLFPHPLVGAAVVVSKQPHLQLTRSLPQYIVGSQRLAGILYHVETVLFGNLHDGRHVGALPEKMRGHDDPRPLRNGSFHRRRIHDESLGVYVHEYRPQPEQASYFGR